MCIIIAKKKGVQFPEVENVVNACYSNPDGFAMAWLKEGKIRTFRTLNDVSFIEFYKKFIKKHKASETPLIIHCRIATHGSIKLKNTHCFVDETIGVVFAHNGILSISNRGDMTDSETYFRDIFVPVYKQCGIVGAELTVNAVIGHSKFALFGEDGDLKTYGDYEEDKGVLYSNTSYKGRRTFSSGSTVLYRKCSNNYGSLSRSVNTNTARKSSVGSFGSSSFKKNADSKKKKVSACSCDLSDRSFVASSRPYSNPYDWDDDYITWGWDY